MIKVYNIYLIKKFLNKLVYISLIFFGLVLVINLIEEINFLKDSQVEINIPIFLTLLNTPSLLYEMFPFIFLISTQFFFMELYDKKEIFTFKHFGLNNLNIVALLSITSLILGILIVTVFYSFSSMLKNEYLKIKNNYASDNKYLAAITKNGLWIKDTFENNIFIINADKIEKDNLLNVSITQFNETYELQKNIIAEKANIKDNEWNLFEVLVSDWQSNYSKFKEMDFYSNFNSTKINNLFSDLSSLNIFKLQELKKDYIAIGYSTDEIDIQNHNILSLPFQLMLMCVISSIIMINNKFKKNIIFNILVGIFFSVIIYYLSHFSHLLGQNGKLPLIFSVWFPLLIILIISSIGIVRLNEK